MKYIYGLVCLFIAGSSVFAQNREIRFEKGSFAEVLDKARQENKLIFMDCYTSWCGPCKLLAKNVFTQDSVADFFNAHFINFTIDMEKGEGVELQKKYGVEAYPTLLLLDAGGEEMYRSVGGCSAETLISNFRRAMDPENSIPVMEKKFAAGLRDTQFVKQYWTALKKGRKFDELKASTEVYFQGMSVRKICDDRNWPLYDEFVDIDNPLHHLMVEHIKEFKKRKGDKLIEDKLYDAYDMAIMGRIPNVGHTAEQVEQYREDILRIGFQDPEQLFYLQSYLNIAGMKVNKQYDEYLDFMEKQIGKFSETERARVIVSLVLLGDAGKDQRERGNRLLINEAQRIMQQHEGKLSAYQQQIFGYIQYKLMNDKKE